MAAKQTSAPQFDLLTREEGLASLSSSGALPLPQEFDTKEYAAHWAKKGTEVGKLQGKQFLPQTVYSAQGWAIWKYPKEVATGELDEKKKPIMVKHEQAELPCEVTLGKGTYVLMFRPAAVQDQVNQVYAQLSRERVDNEIAGNTVDGGPVPQGMLTNEQLTRVLGAEAAAEDGSGPRQTVVHGANLQGRHLAGSRRRVSR
jgi:hypothetical protein